MNRLLLALIVFLPLTARPAAPVANETPVALSPYEVRANSVQFKHWIKIGSPHFILYTDADAADASRALREFEMLHFASQIVFGRRLAQLGQTIIVLPTASSDWRKLESKGGDQEWRSAATSVGGEVTDMVVVQYDWQEMGLGIAHAVTGLRDLDRMDVTAPFWFSRGFGMFYETAEFDGDKVILGRANPRMLNLKNRQWLPWDRFFQVNAKSPEFTKENLVNVYEAQAAVFMQYLFANPDRAWIGRLAAWVEYLNSGSAPTEEHFKAIFGEDWRSWEIRLEKYMDRGRYSMFQVNVPPQFSHFEEKKFKLSVKEMRELFILTQTLVQRVPDSKTSLDALLAKGLESECLRETLTQSCLDLDRRDAALKNIRQLIAAGSTNPRVYREGDALLTSYAGSFGLDLRYGPELAEVGAWDRRGLELEPIYTELNESLASNEACAPTIDQQSITTIEDCYRRVKGRAPTDRVICALAMALWRTGDTKTASELALRIKNDPLTRPSSRKFATDLLARITPPTKPATSH